MKRGKDVFSGDLFETADPVSEKPENAELVVLMTELKRRHPDWDQMSVRSAAQTEINFRKQKDWNKGKTEDYPEDELLR